MPVYKAMTQLTSVANRHANPDQIDLVQAELLKLIPITRAEKACIHYDLHQDSEDPAHFTFVEACELRELWQLHMNATYFDAYAKATHGAVAEFTLNEMTPVA